MRKRRAQLLTFCQFMRLKVLRIKTKMGLVLFSLFILNGFIEVKKEAT